VNLLEEGIGVAVRIGELPDSSMRALRVGSVRQVVCASPEYLRCRGRPSSPEDLANHSIILSSAVSDAPAWRFSGERGMRIQRLKPRLVVNTNDAAIEAAVRNFGVTRLLSYQVAPHLADASLEIILEAFEPEPKPIHIVHREGRFASATVRSFIDFIAEHLRDERVLN